MSNKNKNSKEEIDCDTEQLPRISHREFNKFKKDVGDLLDKKNETIFMKDAEINGMKKIVVENKNRGSKKKEVYKINFDELDKLGMGTERDKKEMERLTDLFYQKYKKEFGI